MSVWQSARILPLGWVVYDFFSSRLAWRRTFLALRSFESGEGDVSPRSKAMAETEPQ